MYEKVFMKKLPHYIVNQIKRCNFAKCKHMKVNMAISINKVQERLTSLLMGLRSRAFLVSQLPFLYNTI